MHCGKTWPQARLYFIILDAKIRSWIPTVLCSQLNDNFAKRYLRKLGFKLQSLSSRRLSNKEIKGSRLRGMYVTNSNFYPSWCELLSNLFFMKDWVLSVNLDLYYKTHFQSLIEIQNPSSFFVQENLERFSLYIWWFMLKQISLFRCFRRSFVFWCTVTQNLVTWNPPL